jgi:DUF2975 family protein
MEAAVDSQTPSRSAKVAYFVVNLMLLVLLAGVALTIVSTAVGLARDGKTILGGRTLPIEAKLSAADIKSLPPGVELREDPKVTLDVQDPSNKQLVLSTAAGVGQWLLFGAVLWLLRGLAGSVRGGEPFGAANAARLRRIGFLLVVGAPVVAVVDWALRLSLANTLPPNEFGSADPAAFDLPFVQVLAGVGAFILAEVFAYGVRLREDVEATV